MKTASASLAVVVLLGGFLLAAREHSNGTSAPKQAVIAAPSACHARGSGLWALPDPRCTPGATNPAVTPGTIYSTICKSGWTSTVRPPESVTEPEKLRSMKQYGVSDPGRYEYDHLIPLELGGATNSARNLWPELNYPTPHGFYDHNPKDSVEYKLKLAVCDHRLTLHTAQQMIAKSWVNAYHTYQ